ncbi:hypothetical protein MMC22_001297 [Lobaria immixta]|nr:hypothetical protein [Lobaria immixta]
MTTPKGFSQPEQPRSEMLDDFALPWCQQLISDPALSPVKVWSRVQQYASTERSFLGKTLWSNSTIRACRGFYRAPITASTTEPAREPTQGQLYALLSLGSDMNGLVDVAHGGLLSVLLDEIMGVLAYTEQKQELVTATLNVKFLKPLPTPEVVLCKASMARAPERRKFWTQGSIEDGTGGVYATGEALFILSKAKL